MNLQTLFRPAPSRSSRANLLWTAAQSVVIWVLLLGVVPAVLLMAERRIGLQGFHFPLQSIIGIGLFLLFSALNVTTGYILAARGKGTPLPTACPRALVISGPYRYVRNPMAVAGIGQGIAVGLMLGSWMVIAYAAAGAVLWHFLLRPAEERHLVSRFDDAYGEYRREVPLWWPRTNAYVRSDGTDSSGESKAAIQNL